MPRAFVSTALTLCASPVAAQEPEPVAQELAEPAAAPDEDSAHEPHGLTGDWGGLRGRLAEQGIEFTGTLILDMHSVVSGGLARDEISHGYLDLTAAFDLERLFGLERAVFVVDGYVINGRDPSAEAVGDFQYFSSIAGPHTAQIGQCYYEQTFGDDTWRLKLGKADANVDFAAPDTGADFVHSGAFYSPTIFTLPTYANPATAVIAAWTPGDGFSFEAGVFDGATNAGIDTGSHGPSTFFGAPSDLFYIAEASWMWTGGADELAGRFTVGAWHHNGDFARFDGGTQDGTEGYYVSCDQELARLGGGELPGTLAGFAQWGASDEDVATADLHFGLGLAASGLSATRPDDALGAYVSSVGFSDEAGLTEDTETAFELFYKYQLASWFVLQPDVQYIVHPGGDETVDDALVLTLRLTVDF